MLSPPAAVIGLERVLKGTEIDSEPEIIEARKRDHRRTNEFLVLVFGLISPGEQGGQILADWFAEAHSVPEGVEGNEDEHAITAIQRALWQIGAAGGYGEAGRRAALSWIEERANAQAAESGLVDQWAAGPTRTLAARTTSSSALPGDLTKAYQQPSAAARTLIAMAERCEHAQAGWEHLPIDPLLDGESRTMFQSALVRLIDEGGPVERPLLRRAAALRNQIGSGARSPSPGVPLPDPYAIVGTFGELLRMDTLADESKGTACAENEPLRQRELERLLGRIEEIRASIADLGGQTADLRDQATGAQERLRRFVGGALN